MLSTHAHSEEETLKINTMAPENIKSIEEIRKKNYKAMTGKADLEIKLKHFCWINEKALNELENISGQVTSFRMKLKGLNNANH